MGDIWCVQAMKTLNVMFDERAKGRHQDEIFERLGAGESLGVILLDKAKEFQDAKQDARFQTMSKVASMWPESHLAIVRSSLVWALDQRQKGNAIKIRWKGDADADETVTRVEMRDDEVLIEFAHPPAAAMRRSA